MVVTQRGRNLLEKATSLVEATATDLATRRYLARHLVPDSEARDSTWPASTTGMATSSNRAKVEANAARARAG